MSILTEVETPTRREWESKCRGLNEDLILAANIIGILHLALWIIDRWLYSYSLALYQQIRSHWVIRTVDSTRELREEFKEEHTAIENPDPIIVIMEK
ncbi:matrix protein 2 [Influenza A virus (A/little yellow-shouldered bat/Guatemala/164/2009(H17N10))]|uniref:Matrix protein 2 n=2 Tax=H17N10 subtype TaxID=1129344 RepID=H6QM86_9INFA|nr:matrix protein 2 [Influenza A virus (A/little yellow-shouldered bat/Guatemala/153/2009(H17N10))]AFC35432.1 matrix protein 2 [Influenza A virus (A/little yellow-shouldered bat/Guatemala/164/2009(H17N10))]AIJ10722.1 matrix protein 2 [synthetic Influenza A virus]